MASDDGSSLIVPPVQGGLTTTGSLNWTDLVSRSVSTTVGVLARISAAGVDTYTVVVGQKLGNQFQLTQRGRANIIGAVQSLRSFQTLGRCLEFGFGIAHLVRVLARTEEGMMCLSLCAALTECFDVMVAAEVLVEMVNHSRAPDELKPSILEWQALLKACAGSLSMTEFPVLAEKYMRLHPTNSGLAYEPRDGNRRTYRGCPRPDTLAKTLLAIGEVSRGSIASITILGGANAGFVAAFCEWHFQLSFHIAYEASGHIIYASRDGVAISIADPSSIMANSQIKFLLQDHVFAQDALLQVAERTYHLQDATNMIRGAARAPSSTSPSASVASVAGRFRWHSVLSDQFGYEREKISDCERAFGGLLGCLCRITKAVVFAESTIPYQMCEIYPYYNESAYGRGLASSLVRLFPELAPMKQYLEEPCFQDCTTALEKYEAHLMVLKMACKCRVCQDKRMEPEVYCLVLLAETLFIVARMMSCVTVPASLMPSRLGFEVLYVRQYEIRTDARSYEVGARGMGSKSLNLVHKLGPAAYAINARANGQYWDALTLFAGRMGTQDELVSAAVRSGLCCFWSLLCMFNNDDIPFGQVTIIPGQIELNKKRYSMILDSELENKPLDSSWYLGLRQEHAALVVQERIDALRAHYQLHDPASDDQRKIDAPAAQMNGLWMEAVGRVHCSLPHDQPKMQWKIKEEKHGYIMHESGDYQCKVYEGMSPLQAVVILLTHDKVVLIVEPEQCLDCCLKNAIASTRTGDVKFTVIRITAPLSSVFRKTDITASIGSRTAMLE